MEFFFEYWDVFGVLMVVVDWVFDFDFFGGSVVVEEDLYCVGDGVFGWVVVFVVVVFVFFDDYFVV